MDETVREIEHHIDRTRDRLGSNLKEIEEKVAAVTDWREQYRARPQLLLGAALAGGVLLAIALRPKASRGAWAGINQASGEAVSRRGVNVRCQAMDLWDDIQAALIGVAGARVKGYIAEWVPGFDEHYRRVERQRTGPDFTGAELGRAMR